MRTIILCLLIFAVACDNTLPKDPDNGLATVDTGTTGASDEDADADADGTAFIDEDGDGHLADVDCDDTDPDIYPGAAEVCDEVDNNCNDEIDEGLELTTWWPDSDGDGYGDSDPSTSISACSMPEGYVDNDDDCHDSFDFLNPDAVEVCDELDNDCDGLFDDEDPSLSTLTGGIFYLDSDGDGYGDVSMLVRTCVVPDGYVYGDDDIYDCDDSDGTIHPDATEICDGIDNDCDGAFDDDDSSLTGSLSTFYIDDDGDGLGSATDTLEGCTPPIGYVSNMVDCDDGDAGIGAATDWYTDADGDGYGGAYEVTLCMGYSGLTELDGDCNDDDPTIGPDEVDYCGDGIDHDCSGETDDWGPECLDLEPQDVLSMVSCSGSETGAAFTVEGDHIKARYGTHGMWWDTATSEGLQIKPAGSLAFKDVTYPGSPLDYLIVDVGTSSSSIGRWPGASSDYSVVCAQSVRVGDVIGAIHRYNYSWGSWVGLSSLSVTKSELWNEDGETMLIEFAIQPGLFAGVLTPRIQRVTDFDIDGDSDTENATVFDQDSSTGFVATSGPVSDVTVGMGDCSSAGSIGSFEGWYSADTPTEALCNPRAWTSDAMTIYDLESTSASALEPAHHGYVLTIGNSATEAETLWNDNASDYCGEIWEPSSSASFPGGMCNGTIIWVPDDLAEL